MDNLFVRAWKGQASLAAAFWLIYVVFGIILSLILSLIFSLAVPNFSLATHGHVISAVMFPWTLYAAVCVWRCGRNSAFIWRLLSRIVIIFSVIGGLFNVYFTLVGPPVATAPAPTTPAPAPAQQV